MRWPMTARAAEAAGEFRIEEIYLRVDQQQGFREHRVASCGGVTRQAQ